MRKSGSCTKENIMGTEENAGYQEKMLVTRLFPFFTMFLKGFLPKVVKSQNCMVKD